jgi:uncharacterized membrane-anchored protein
MSGEEQAASQGAEEKPSANAPEETLKLGAEEMIKRRSRWQSSLAALRYVSSVSQDNEVKLRDSDRATSLWLLVVCVFALLSLVLPQLVSADQPPFIFAFLQWMASQRFPLVLCADALVGAGLVLYVTNRFGIVTTLTPRQALLTWHLMLGSSLLGIFLAINLAMLCWVAVENTHIVIQEAHPSAQGAH